jgi:hypothetical protein
VFPEAMSAPYMHALAFLPYVLSRIWMNSVFLKPLFIKKSIMYAWLLCALYIRNAALPFTCAFRNRSQERSSSDFHFLDYAASNVPETNLCSKSC